MIAKGFKPVIWVTAVGTAALACYMLSLRVAAERADLAGLERRIISTQQQIRALNTELGTRGRVQQLQLWNDEVLALVAPVSGQYLAGGVSLARFETRQPVLADQAEVRMASAEVPAPGAPAAPVSVQPQRAVAAAPAPAAPLRQPAMVHRASLTVEPAAPAAARAEPPRPAAAAARPPVQPARTRTASAEPAPVRAEAPPRPAAQRARPATGAPARPAARQAALLDESTLRDLGSAARAERGGGTRR